MQKEMVVTVINLKRQQIILKQIFIQAQHYLQEENNFPSGINKEDYSGFTLECQPYGWNNQSLTPMQYRPVIEKELPSV